MNKVGYFWPICAFDVTCIVFFCNSLVECSCLSYVNFISIIHEMNIYMLVADILVLGHGVHHLTVNFFH